MRDFLIFKILGLPKICFLFLKADFIISRKCFHWRLAKRTACANLFSTGDCLWKYIFLLGAITPPPIYIYIYRLLYKIWGGKNNYNKIITTTTKHLRVKTRRTINTLAKCKDYHTKAEELFDDTSREVNHVDRQLSRSLGFRSGLVPRGNCIYQANPREAAGEGSSVTTSSRKSLSRA